MTRFFSFALIVITGFLLQACPSPNNDTPAPAITYGVVKRNDSTFTFKVANKQAGTTYNEDLTNGSGIAYVDVTLFKAPTVGDIALSDSTYVVLHVGNSDHRYSTKGDKITASQTGGKFRFDFTNLTETPNFGVTNPKMLSGYVSEP